MKEYDKDNPHKDIGKQKFRVKKHYTAWVEYDVIANSKDEAEDKVIEYGGIDRIEWQDGCLGDAEVYACNHNFAESEDTVKVAECIPFEDSEGIYYDDPEWSTSDFEWKIEEK